MDEDMWPPVMHARQQRVEEIFDRQDQIKFLRLVWPCDTGRGEGVAQTMACIWASGDDNNGIMQPVHLQALDDEEMIEDIIEFMVNRLCSGDSGSIQAKQVTPRKPRRGG